MDVPTQHGVIRGQVVLSPFGTEVEQFLGIPFAVPPIGSRRFGNPELYGEFPGGNFANIIFVWFYALTCKMLPAKCYLLNLTFTCEMQFRFFQKCNSVGVYQKFAPRWKCNLHIEFNEVISWV